MRVELETVKEYVVTLTEEEAADLCDFLNNSNTSGESKKMSETTKRQYDTIDTLYEEICEALENEEQNNG